jgi:hypothetical protein
MRSGRACLPAMLLPLASMLLFGGCQAGLDDGLAPAQLDEPFFRCRVQPVLTQSCAAFACHGDGRRFFRVFARNRLRLGGTEADRNAFLNEGERGYNYASASALVVPGRPDESLLLRKPLDEGAGGYFHQGAHIFGGGDVFLDREDGDYQVIAQWIEGATEDPSCIEPGSDQ